MSEFTPKVSIIIPVYNGERTIKECLDSVIAQNYPSENLDVIVVNNCSTDKTAEIVKSFPVRLVFCGKRGAAAARNFGISQSEANIIAFTDADCIADPNWIRELVRSYENPLIGGIGGNIQPYVHGERTIIEIFSAEFSPLVNYGGENASEFLPRLYTANASFRRNLLDQIGGFNEKLITADDVDISWRMQMETGTQLAYAPQAVIYHHHRSTWKGLGRQYRQYGYGEIILDIIYGKNPGYPRNLGFQIKRIAGQILQLPKYLLSRAYKILKQKMGKATDYEAMVPAIWFLIERNNILGKIDALWATRFMTDTSQLYQNKPDALISRYFPTKKEY